MTLSSTFRLYQLVKRMGFALLLLTGTLAYADPLSDRVVRATGIDRQLELAYENLGEQFAVGFQQSSGLTLGDDFLQVVDRSLSAAPIVDAIKQGVDGKLSKSQIDSLMQWLNSDLGRKIIELEVRAGEPRELEKLAAQINQVAADQSSMQRAAQLDEILALTDQAMLQTEGLQIAVLEGLVANKVSAQQFEAMQTQMKQGLAESRPQIEQVTRAMSAFAYRSISDAEFAAYLTFLNDPATKALNEATLLAQSNAVQAQYKELGQNIADFLANYQANR